jgi:hypothetical protein
LTSVIITLAAVCLAGLAYWRYRWTAGVRATRSLAVFALARTASTDQVRQQASEAVIAFGEDLENAPADDNDLGRALDAYRAATAVFDSATSLVDLAGVLVLVNEGRRGEPLCFFNPLHGPSSTRTTWRLIGTREQLRVPACAECSRAVRRHRPPLTLADSAHGKDIPYFEADPAWSVWAATGFGVFSDDLIDRILRGDLHRRRPKT